MCGRGLCGRVLSAIPKAKGFRNMTPDKDEIEAVRRVGAAIFGKLAMELPPREFEILLDLWIKYKADMQKDMAA